MCGIGGIVSWAGPIAPERVAAIGGAQAHRGPDGAGELDRGWFGFAHRRLAIIDLIGSAQPMSDPSGRFSLTYNGEIFNFQELRTRLESKGHEFRTSGDVEVLLRLLMEEGPEALPLIDGQFAFAFADAERGTVLLARDRVGIKPLHYVIRAGELVFASELDGVLAAVPRPPIRDASIDLYLTLRYVPAPWTIYDGVLKLLPGTSLTVHKDGHVDGPTAWHRIDAPRAPSDPPQEDIEAVLAAAVRSQLVADVPLGVLLSGGIDSSVVAALAARALPRGSPLRTLTVGFQDARFDERPYARVVADALATDHREIAGEGGGAGAAEAFAAFGEPFADSSVGPTASLFAAARSAVTVALGGDGGDELFFGYRVYQRALTAALARRAAEQGGIGARVGVVARRVVSPRFRRLLRTTPLDLLIATRTIMGPAARRRLYRGTRLETLPDPLPGTAWIAAVARRAEDASGGDPMRALAIFDLLGFLPDCALTKVDRLSMRRGLEVRVPLLANAVLDLALALPTGRKARVEGTRCQGGKEPLRVILARQIPALDLTRTKRGFGAPPGEPADAVVAALLPEDVARGEALRPWCDPRTAQDVVRGRADGVRRGEAALAVAALGAFLCRTRGGVA